MKNNEPIRNSLSTLFSNIAANSNSAEQWLKNLDSLSPTEGTKPLRDIIISITNDSTSANKLLREYNSSRYNVGSEVSNG